MKPLVLLVVAAVAASQALADEQPIRISIAPGKVGELCMPLKAGDTLTWHFKASAATDFNLHHHVDKDVLMSVDRKAITQDRAEHRVDHNNDWCLMWTAPAAQPVTVTGGWQVKKTQEPKTK